MNINPTGEVLLWSLKLSKCIREIGLLRQQILYVESVLDNLYINYTPKTLRKNKLLSSTLSYWERKVAQLITELQEANKTLDCFQGVMRILKSIHKI